MSNPIPKGVPKAVDFNTWFADLAHIARVLGGNDLISQLKIASSRWGKRFLRMTDAMCARCVALGLDFDPLLALVQLLEAEPSEFIRLMGTRGITQNAEEVARRLMELEVQCAGNGTPPAASTEGVKQPEPRAKPIGGQGTTAQSTEVVEKRRLAILTVLPASTKIALRTQDELRLAVTRHLRVASLHPSTISRDLKWLRSRGFVEKGLLRRTARGDKEAG